MYETTGWDAWQKPFIEQFERQHRRRRTRLTAGELEAAHRIEWDATGVGRLGQVLLAELDPYLEFFLIARRP
jgi:hypothetical protein